MPVTSMQGAQQVGAVDSVLERELSEQQQVHVPEGDTRASPQEVGDFCRAWGRRGGEGMDRHVSRGTEGAGPGAELGQGSGQGCSAWVLRVPA